MPAWAGPVEDFDVSLKHYQNKKFDLSAAGFGDFIAKFPNHERRALADLYYGQSLMQLRRFPEARAVFSEFLKANPTHTDYALAMYREAECAFFVNDLTAASQLFAAFVAKFPENELSAWAWYYLGESHLQLGSPEKAATAFQSGLEKFPTSPRAAETKFAMGRAYSSLKDIEKAARTFQEIADDPMNPRAPDALFALGSMQFDAGHLAEAAAAFDAVREKFPKYRQAVEAALNSGSSYYKLKEYDKAVTAFEAAAQGPGDRLTARFWAAQARRSQERYDDAIAINKAAYEEFKDDPNAAKLLYYWGDCEFRKGDLEAAVPLFVRFADTYATHDFADDSLHYAVEASLKAGDLARAEELHQRFLRDYPRSGLTMLESILHGRILLARAEALSPAPPPGADARAALLSAAEVFDGVAKASKIERTSAWATLLLARTRSKLPDWQGVIEATTPLNERLSALEKPEEFAESLYLTGVAAAELQQWVLADASFDRYLKLTNDPKNAAAALSQLVLARTKAGKLNELDELWPRFTEAGVPAEDLGNAILAAADSAMKQERFAEAAQLFERLEALPEAAKFHAAARSGLGHAKFNQKDYVAAAEAFGRLISDPPTDNPVLVADAAFMKGHSLDQAQRREDAAAAFQSGALLIAGKEGRLGDPPAEPRAAWLAFESMRSAATQYEAMDDIVKADDAYAQSWEYLQKLPADKKANLDKLLYSWARANYVAKKFDRADELYARLLRNHPASSFADDAALYLTESMVLSGKSAEAEIELKKLLASPTTDDAVRPEVLHNLVELAADRDGWDDVQTFARELIERFPNSSHRTNAKYRLGEAALKSGDVATARELFTELRIALNAEMSPADSELAEGIWILSAEAAIATPAANQTAVPVDHAAIDGLVEEFHKRFPQSKLTYLIDYIQGRSLIRRAPPDVEKARIVLQSVVDSPDGKNTETAANAHLRLADTYLLAQKADEYPTAYRLYYDVSVRYEDPVIQAAALFKAGEIQEKMAKRDGAVETYRELLMKFPTSTEAEKARARLKALGADAAPAEGAAPKPAEDLPKTSPEPKPAEDLPKPAPEPEPTPATSPTLPSIP
ncbi:tol-pal system protein YbgF [Caulifigura coniformis]|uniref:Tol-pal system protein YbgF n=1 Tax=Caulifigura coniformis TaxID=2527983 RepID=A0A517SG15_9PLAN|nr:tetratricopeptide repeat protein [Caulifigura coniformis]QDT55064.1 tol-pal system protein YbgF [Caulifigura coniformis]